MNAEPSSESGFTLIETLVGFVILCGTIIMAFSTMTASLQRMQRTAEIIEASKIAQSVLDTLVINNIGAAVASTQKKARFTWQIDIRPLEAKSDTPIYPAMIKIAIFDQAGHAITQASLETILLLRRQ